MRLESPGKVAIGIIPKFPTPSSAFPRLCLVVSPHRKPLRPPVSPAPRLGEPKPCEGCSESCRVGALAKTDPRLGGSRSFKANQRQNFFSWGWNRTCGTPVPLLRDEFFGALSNQTEAIQPMSNYSYEAVDAGGLKIEGKLEVVDQNEAIRRLKEMGLFPVR